METATISVFSPDGKADTGLSIFFMCTSTSLFTSSTFYENLNISHEFLKTTLFEIRYHFKLVKVPGTTS
jgi:hypothetical protein